MREEVGYLVKDISDHEHKVLSPQWVYDIFSENYLDNMPLFQINECHFKQVDGIMAEAIITCGDKKITVDANGNGRLDAVSNAIKQYFNVSYQLSEFEEHALTQGSSSKAIAYVGITCNGEKFWGAGMDDDIIKASIHALCVSVNKLPQIQSNGAWQDERMMEIMNYIQGNYQEVALSDVAEHFHCQSPI